MPLSTITFQELRMRSERGLTKAEFEPGVAAEQEDTRTEIGNLLDDRAHIEELASTQEQRKSYGIEKFHTDFVMLRTLQEHEHCSYEGEELRRFIWSRVEDSRFKRFQELFCHEYQFVVPKFQILEKNRVLFPRGTNFQQMRLEACQVSPDRISDNFAQNIGLCTFDDADTPLTRLEKKKKAIPRLKLIFDSAIPLQQGHQRILQIEEQQPETAKRYATTVPEEALGRILYTRENGNGHTAPAKGTPKAPRRLIVSPFKSAYGALRKTAYEHAGYDREQLDLIRLKEEIASLNRRCDREWKGQISDAKRDAIIKNAREILEEGHLLLEHCVDHCKVSANIRIQRCGELLTKKNVSAAMGTMVGTLNDLTHRLEPIAPIQGHNDQDRITLHRHITEQEILIKDFRRTIEDAAGTFDGDSEITNATMLGIFAHDLSRISLQPLRTFADRISEKLLALDQSLLRNDTFTAKTSLIQMHVIGKFQAIRTCFEHIKYWLTNGRIVPAEKLQQFVGRLNNILKGREVYPDIAAESYAAVFEEMQTKLAAIEERLAHYAAHPLSGNEHTSMQQKLREYLDTFDIEEIVKKLP